MVKSILYHGLKRRKDKDNIKRVLEDCQMFEKDKPAGKKPQPISKSDFRRLLEASDVKWRAVFLLSLNAALYPQEVADVRLDDIDLEEGTLSMDRKKTGVPRVAVLWKRTVRAIREYQRAEPHESDHLFASHLGEPYNSNHMGRNFRRRRAAAGLPETVQFAQLRDGAETNAIKGGADLTQAKLLAGHQTGISDHYVEREPKMVADACKAIERHYFN